jgi:hypothetical protein
MAIVTKEFFKSYFAITVNTWDVKIDALIPAVEQDYLDIRNVPFDTDDNDLIVYPIGSDITACEMIAFKLSQSKTIADAGKVIQSETIDSYRGSYGLSMTGSIQGYPKQIAGPIKSYADGR